MIAGFLGREERVMFCKLGRSVGVIEGMFDLGMSDTSSVVPKTGVLRKRNKGMNEMSWWRAKTGEFQNRKRAHSSVVGDVLKHFQIKQSREDEMRVL